MLGSRDVYLPSPETATGKLVRRQARRGPAPSSWELCIDCGGEGQRFDRFQRATVCPSCHGRGRRKVDDYTGEEVATSTPLSFSDEFVMLLDRGTRRVPCDRCAGSGAWKFRRCELCDGTGTVPVPGSWLSDPELEQRAGGDGFLNALERHETVGSYHELELCLDELRARAPRCRRLLDDVYVDGKRQADELEQLDQLALRAAVLFLDAHMPTTIVVPAAIAAAERRRQEQLRTVKGKHSDGRAIAARNAEIRKLLRTRSVQWVAGEFGLSVSQVYELKNKGSS